MTISLIIPVYNTAPWLNACLESVVSQTIPFHEIILINDGSTDQSDQICRAYALQYHNINYIKQSNQGLGATRNIGLNIAQGDYVMFLDSDDFLETDTVAFLCNAISSLETPAPDVVFFDATPFSDNQQYDDLKNEYQRTPRAKALSGSILSGQEWFLKTFPRDFFPSACLALYHLPFIQKNNLCFPEKVLYEDNPFSFKVYMTADTVVYLDKLLYFRRYRDGSITTVPTTELHSVGTNIITADIIQYLLDHSVLLMSNSRYCQFAVFFFEIALSRIEDLQKGSQSAPDAYNSFFKLLDNIIILLNKAAEYPDYFNTDSLVRILLIAEKLSRLFSGSHSSRVEEYLDFCNRIQLKQLITDRLCGLLKSIPFSDKSKTVGLYGVGSVCEGMLSLYQSLIGRLESNIILIDSYRNDGVFLSYPITNVSNLPAIDCFVISSYGYDLEIFEILKKMKTEAPVINFFETALSTDIFSPFTQYLPLLLETKPLSSNYERIGS